MWYLIVSIPDLCTLTYFDQTILNYFFKVKSGQSPDYMVEHFIPASSLHMELDLAKLVVFLFQNENVLERNPLDIMVVFHGTSSLVILGSYRDIQILK